MGFFDFMYTGGIKEITVIEAHQRQSEGALLIDIGDIYEWNKAHAEGAIHVPMASLLNELSKLEKHEIEASGPIMLICMKGDRTISAAGRLVTAGYEAVSVHGGTTAWKSAGLPIAK